MAAGASDIHWQIQANTIILFRKTDFLSSLQSHFLVQAQELDNNIFLHSRNFLTIYKHHLSSANSLLDLDLFFRVK